MANILVVDDNESIRNYLRTLLSYVGHTVTEAGDGREALTRVQVDRPDLVISDILMPTMDGFEFAQGLRSQDGFAETPVIFYTGTFDLAGAQGLAHSCGVCRILEKPAMPQQILESVSDALGSPHPKPTPLATESFRETHEQVVLSRLSQKLDALGSQLAALIECAIELTSLHDPTLLLQRVCRSARRVIGCRIACVELFNDVARLVATPIADGMEPDAVERMGKASLPPALASTALVSRRAVHILAANADQSMQQWLAQFPAAQDLLVVPLASPLQVFGLIYLVGAPDAVKFKEVEERLGVALAAIAGRCLESCSLYAGLEIKADALSGQLAERSAALERVNGELQEELTKRAAANESLRRLQEQLQDQNQHLVKLTAMTSDFVDQVSHDFRTPLSVIKESAALLFEGHLGPISDDQKSFLAMLMDRASNLAVMVDDILDMSRLDAGILPMHRGYHRVESLFDGLRLTLKHKAMANQITLEFETEDGLPDIYCDPGKVGRAIINLATNAIKFCKEGSVVRIWARMDSDPIRIRLGVTDNGPGLAPEDIQRLFERFEQVKGGAAALEGFGLGLNIVRNLVRLNLSEIEVASEQGQGSTFSFALPCGDPAAIVQSQLPKLAHARTDSPVVSLVRAEADGGVTESDLELLFHQMLRHTDLLFRAADHAWLIVCQCDEAGVDQLTERVERARVGANRNRPQGGFPAIRWTKLGLWRTQADNDLFSQAIEQACRAREAVHV